MVRAGLCDLPLGHAAGYRQITAQTRYVTQYSEKAVPLLPGSPVARACALTPSHTCHVA
jgi:hypothetical protein